MFHGHLYSHLHTGILCDPPTSDHFLSPDNHRVCSLDPYLEDVGVSTGTWIACSHTIPNFFKLCGHMWNPQMKYAFQTMAWLEGNFRVIKLTQVFRQTEEKWIDTLNKLKTGAAFEEKKTSREVSAFLDGLQRPLPVLSTGIAPTILHTHCGFVERENFWQYAQLPGQVCLYQKAVDAGVCIEYKLGKTKGALANDSTL